MKQERENMEALLHYCWKHKLLPLGSLETTEGQKVEVIDPGLHNMHAGPDFFNAKVKIDGTLWVGNVEIHERASDWYVHGHDHDAAYDNVVLHVVYENDTAITMQNCHQLPTLEVKHLVADALWDNYEALMHPPKPLAVPCEERLAEVPEMYVNGWMERLTLERCGYWKRVTAIGKSVATGCWHITLGARQTVSRLSCWRSR